MAVLRAEKLVKVYSRRKVVNEVTIEVKNGEVVGLLGPNGAGKTTTFYMIVGLLTPESGRIYIDEEDVTRLPMHLRARRGISYLPQEASVFRKLTVEENILAILEIMREPKEERKKRTDELINKFNLNKVRKSRASILSGGERRKVEIARALATKPVFLLLDEPFTGIDPISRSDLQDIIMNLREMGIGILITDHNVRETLEITDSAYVIYDGKVLLSGKTEELINNEEARRIYLGERFRL
ncbi:LPS export ABC transporter ATP-binding protein [candidate division WOR-3 bacterium]|nr:LPS export ABC transporter ATP-binding protein [candidate division WOR-3 bacterium]